MHFKTLPFLISLALHIILPNFSFSQSPQTLSGVQISFTNNGTHTAFTLTSSQGGNLANSWVAVGLNSKASMAGTDIIMCLNPSSGSPTIQHRYAISYNTPDFIDSNTALGISTPSVTLSGTNLVCSFTRQNSNANANYFNLNTNSPYLLAAYGPLNNGVPQYHTSRQASSNVVSFSVTVTTTTQAPTTTTTQAPTTTTTQAPTTTTTQTLNSTAAQSSTLTTISTLGTTTSSVTTTSATSAPVTIAACRDSQSNCKFWANYCYLLSDIKPHPCAVTCNACATTTTKLITTSTPTTTICVDKSGSICAAWAKYCDLLSDIKPFPCAKTCKKC